MEKIFSNGNPKDGRDILIKIENGLISFYFYAQYKMHRQWVQEEKTYRDEVGIEPLLEDEERDKEFYYISKKEWDNDKTERLDRPDNWHNHMKEKNWFTDEMKEFIDNN